VQFPCDSTAFLYVIIINDWDAHDLFVHCQPKLNSPVACRFIPSPPQPQTRAYACGRQGRWERLTGDRRHPVFMADVRLCVDLVSEAWLNWCHWRDAAVLSATAHGSRFVGTGVRISQHGYIEAADRSCLRRVRWSNLSGPGIKRNALYPYRLQCQDSDLSDLYRRYTRLSFRQWLLCVYTSPPAQGMNACVRVGGGGFELRKQSSNKVWLSINNRLIQFD